MKKIYPLLIGAALCASTAANADTFTVDDLQYTTLDESTCELTKTWVTSGDLVIPSTVTNDGTEYTVVSIKSGVFRSNGITSCVVPGTVKKTCNALFNMCRQLKTVTFEEGVEELGYNCFTQCGQLTTVNLPSTLTVLGGEDPLFGSTGGAFNGCSSLQSIDIPAGITEIPDNTFTGCTSLASITFAGEITSIGSNAFNNCSALNAELSFPALTALSPNAFSYSGIKKIEFGPILTAIPNEAMYGCASLEQAVFSEGMQTIGSFAFNNCTALTAVEFPATVTELSSDAFKGCTAITSIECKSMTPPAAVASTFPASVYEDAVLSVPAAALEDYKAAECWKLFTTFSAVTGVNGITTDGVTIQASAGAIVIGGTRAVAEVYTVSGQCVARTSARRINVAPGLYIVRAGNRVAKVSVR